MAAAVYAESETGLVASLIERELIAGKVNQIWSNLPLDVTIEAIR